MFNNSVSIIGRLTRDVDVKKTTSGKSVGRFTLAVENGKDKQGQEKPADFIDFVIWDKAAENMQLYSHKGNLIAVSGEIHTHSYDRKDGTKAKVIDVLVKDWKNLTPKSNNPVQIAQNNNYSEEESFDNYMMNNYPTY